MEQQWSYGEAGIASSEMARFKQITALSNPNRVLRKQVKRVVDVAVRRVC